MKKHFPDPEHELGLPRGWAIRPFSILASSFKTVVLADADTTFLRDPRILLNETGFLGYGSLFWHNRTLQASTEDNYR